MRNLTTKQRLFVEHYLANPNGKDAARKAGYKGSDTAMSVMATKLLANAKIRPLLEARITKAAMSADEVLEELATIAKGGYADYRGDKVRALELVGKYHKLFTEKTEHSGEVQHKVTQIVIQGVKGNSKPTANRKGSK